MRELLAWVLVMIPLALRAQEIKIGLYQDHLVQRAVVYCSSGSYALSSEGERISRLEEGEILYLTLEGGKIRVLDSDSDFGIFGEIELASSAILNRYTIIFLFSGKGSPNGPAPCPAVSSRCWPSAVPS